MARKKKEVAGTQAGPVDVDAPPPKRPTRKRKQVSYAEPDAEDPEWIKPPTPKKAKKSRATGTEEAPIAVDEASPKRPAPKKKSKGKAKVDGGVIEYDGDGEELRLRELREYAPESYLKVKDRAITQRLFLLDRERCGTEEIPEEKVQIAGTTGNVYTVHIKRIPKCTCPHHIFGGNLCKHIIYVMLLTLKAREDLAYQTALTSSELRDLFSKAPPIPSADAESPENDGNRKPIEDECPICYMEFEPDKEEISYCRAACGKNVHKECIDKWLKTKRDAYAKPTCPYCRSEWVENEASKKAKNVLEGAVRGHGQFGYMNIAHQLGLDRDE